VSNLEEQKKHYDKLLTHIENMLERYAEYKEQPEVSVPFGAREKEGSGEEKEHTAYTQLCIEISQLNFDANNPSNQKRV